MIRLVCHPVNYIIMLINSDTDEHSQFARTASHDGDGRTIKF